MFIVSRITAKTATNELDIELDVNTDIYPMEKDGNYALALVTSLNQDGTEEFDIFTYINGSDGGGPAGGLSSLLEEYQYVVHGKVFKQSIDKDKLSVYISFGGLLMSMTGKQSNLKNLEIDARVYLLLKKL